MTDDSCLVGIHASQGHDVERYAGRVLFRAYAMGCHQHGQWRRTQVEAEDDARRMDAHRCPERSSDAFERLIPHRSLRTAASAILSPETALRYLPWKR